MDYSTLNPQYYKDPKNDEVAGIIYRPDGFTITVPLDTENAEYVEMMEQVKAGTLTIKDAD
jgi:hypothetical protein